MEGESRSAAVDTVVRILARASEPEPPFPPAELYSEGWMLRLVMESHHQSHNTLPIPLTAGSRWYSEARLLSPFQPSHRGDPHGEGITHADGVVGQFQIRPDTTAGFILGEPVQFAVIEAKMGSQLSAGTTRVAWYDQAVRNVAAMAWAINEAGHQVDDYESLSFIVAAPTERFELEPTFVEYTSRESLGAKLEQRIGLYESDDPKRYESLVRFKTSVFDPMLQRLDIRLWSWEEAILGVEDNEFSASLDSFYKQCLRHAALGSDTVD